MASAACLTAASSSPKWAKLVARPRSTSPKCANTRTTARPNAPINVFIHGGAWRGGLAKDSAYPAELFLHAGAHYVVLDFINVIEAGGNLTPMADQVRRAVAWVARNARSFGGDPDRAAFEAPVRYGRGPVQLPLDAPPAPAGPVDTALSA